MAEEISAPIVGRSFVTPDLTDLNACKVFVHAIAATGVRVEFTVDIELGQARILIGSSLAKMRVPPKSVIFIVDTVVYALDRLTLDEGVGTEVREWGGQ